MAGQIPAILSVNSVLLALTLMAVGARVGRRVFIMRAFSGHDTLIIIAAVSAFIFSILQMVGTELGLGLRKEDFDPANEVSLSKLMLSSNIFYFIANWAVKHALLLFYSEIARERKFEISIWIMHFVAFGFGLSSMLVNIFQCRPFHKAWHHDAPGYCVNLGLFLRFNAAIMLATDLVLYIMPLVFTWNLQLRRAQRLGLNLLFGLGGLVLAVSSVRVYSVHKFASDSDQKWWYAQTMIWSVLENHIAIIVACAPSVKVIALLFFPRIASSLERMVSKVTLSSSRSRSRSRASGPCYATSDLESGLSKNQKPKLAPLSTPMNTPSSPSSGGGSRASRNFIRWFRSPTSPRQMFSIDSMESDLVGEQEVHSAKDVPMVSIGNVYHPGREQHTRMGNSDIRVEHTITVEERSARRSEESAGAAVGRSV